MANEGSYPENARALALNGAEVIYRASYPHPATGNDYFEIQNRMTFAFTTPRRFNRRTRSMKMTTQPTSKLVPPFTRETAIHKVRRAEDGWNSRNPQQVSLAYTPDSK
jgi:hypothetical protein